jgi:hypothetical protein
VLTRLLARWQAMNVVERFARGYAPGMTEPGRDTPRDDSDQRLDDEESRTSIVENDTSPLADDDAQPGRAAVSDRREHANPTGNLGQSDYPVDGG